MKLRSYSARRDPDLLAYLDYLNEVKAMYPSCTLALTKGQNRFYDYLQRRFDYTPIPIRVGTTHFDERQGHHTVDKSFSPRLARAEPGVIVQTIRDGFKRGEEIVQFAEVVSNQPAASWLRRIKKVRPGRYYVEIQTTVPLAIERLIDEATGHFRIIDLIYSILAIMQSQMSNGHSLATNLQRYADSSIQLSQLADSIYGQLRTAQLDPLRLRYARRDAPADKHFNFIVLGADVALDATREIILKQATDQSVHTYFVPPDVEWLKTCLQRLREMDDQICDALAKGIATLLTNLAFASDLLVEHTSSKIELRSPDETSEQELTPERIATELIPYLCAVADIQCIIDKARKQESNEVIITSITKGSFSVGFQGGKDVLDLILSLIIPWRKAHAKEIARLKEEKMKLDQEKLRAETRQIDAQTNETNARAAKERQEACKIFLENSQLQQALENGLAAKMAEEIHGPEWHNLRRRETGKDQIATAISNSHDEK
jgi:hypothetical protein